jgi:acetylornithine deacetylase
MPPPSVDRACAVLSDLIALQTVNPMGRPYSGDSPVERPVIEYLERLFSPFGLEMRRDRCSAIHESLLITIPGRTNAPGTLLEAHVDTVPADDWLQRAFRPRREGATVFGRGACDDKGSLTAMALSILELLESGERPPQTVWFLAAGDEEYAQAGIKKFVAEHQSPIGRGVFGEPTDCIPVIQHKGTIRWDITAHGRSAHTSQPEIGHSAILDIVKVIEALAKYERKLCARYTSALMSGPSITVTMIEGGRSRNMVPENCTIAVDFRVLPGMDPRHAVDELREQLTTLELSVTHSEFQCFAPALNTEPNDPFVRQVVEFCQNGLRQSIAPAGVPYGSDASWIPSNIPAIVLGPGNIAQAHAVDECVDLGQIVQGAVTYRRILEFDWLEEVDTDSSKATSPA